ncbi:MAG TPA: succinate dehydrogenase cytochrome b subunit [Edaphocola sp.]|nr:succinate dehydrogenase cytochrome b subunit [Edaphocola sp.]
MKHFLTSAIGKKIVMGLTGFLLMAFLVVHCYVNGLYFVSGKEAFDAAAHFLGTNLLMHILEAGLFLGFILHIIQGILLEIANRAKRKVKYEVSPGNKSSKWYTRSMAFLGILILLFLVIHLGHFWLPNRGSQVMGEGEIDLVERMQLIFSSPIPVVIYVLGCLALGYHLLHGFWSAFHTFGLDTPKYKKAIRAVGTAFAIIIPLLFAAMPVAFYIQSLG